jgi:hypothetical protein
MRKQNKQQTKRKAKVKAVAGARVKAVKIIKVEDLPDEHILHTQVHIEKTPDVPLPVIELEPVVFAPEHQSGWAKFWKSLWS